MTRWFGAVLFLALCLALPGTASALGAMGKVTVKLNGFFGRHETRLEHLEIQFSGLTTRSNENGAFKFRDLSEHGIQIQRSGEVRISNRQENWVKFSVGRQRITLPITWRGEVRGRWLVLYPVLCELNADETGACDTDAEPLAPLEVRLRRFLGMQVPSHLLNAPKPNPPMRPVPNQRREPPPDPGYRIIRSKPDKRPEPKETAEPEEPIGPSDAPSPMPSAVDPSIESGPVIDDTQEAEEDTYDLVEPME